MAINSGVKDTKGLSAVLNLDASNRRRVIVKLVENDFIRKTNKNSGAGRGLTNYYELTDLGRMFISFLSAMERKIRDQETVKPSSVTAR